MTGRIQIGIAAALLLFGFPQCARAQKKPPKAGPQQPVDPFDEPTGPILLENGKALHALHQATEKAWYRLKALEIALDPPYLVIGEFESEADFNKRRAAAIAEHKRKTQDHPALIKALRKKITGRVFYYRVRTYGALSPYDRKNGRFFFETDGDYVYHRDKIREKDVRSIDLRWVIHVPGSINVMGFDDLNHAKAFKSLFMARTNDREIRIKFRIKGRSKKKRSVSSVHTGLGFVDVGHIEMFFDMEILALELLIDGKLRRERLSDSYPSNR